MKIERVKQGGGIEEVEFDCRKLITGQMVFCNGNVMGRFLAYDMGMAYFSTEGNGFATAFGVDPELLLPARTSVWEKLRMCKSYMQFGLQFKSDGLDPVFQVRMPSDRKDALMPIVEQIKADLEEHGLIFVDAVHENEMFTARVIETDRFKSENI